MADQKIDSPVESRIVYVRAMSRDELPAEARAQVRAEALYAIHDETGARLAVTDDRAAAFTLARMHEMTPVSAH
jgi:hypothetical protein